MSETDGLLSVFIILYRLNSPQNSIYICVVLFSWGRQKEHVKFYLQEFAFWNLSYQHAIFLFEKDYKFNNSRFKGCFCCMCYLVLYLYYIFCRKLKTRTEIRYWGNLYNKKLVELIISRLTN